MKKTLTLMLAIVTYACWVAWIIDDSEAAVVGDMNFAAGAASDQYTITFNNTVDALNFQSATNGIIMSFDGANTRLGIGTVVPESPFHIRVSGTAGVPAPEEQTIALFQRSSLNSFAYINIVAASNRTAGVHFGDTDDVDVGKLDYDHDNESMDFWVNALERVTIDSAGSMGIGATTPDTKLEVAGATTFLEITEPADPATDKSVTWHSAGGGFGDPGDYIIKINDAGSVKTITLVDFSAVTDEDP